MNRESRAADRAELPACESCNPLDASFGSHARLARGNTSLGNSYIEFADSIYKHLSLPTIVRLAQVAERHPEALKYFPPGSKLVVSADGDRGDAWESGYLMVYCELRFQGADGKSKSSGRESLSIRSQSGVEAAFEKYLRSLEGSSEN